MSLRDAFLLLPISLVGCSSSTTAPLSTGPGTDAGEATETSVEAGPAPQDSGPVALEAGTGLALGTVTVTAPSVMCPAAAGAGASCMTINVSCPGIPDDGATVAIVAPSGNVKGTIVGHAGGGGTGYFNGGAGASFASAYPAAGYRYVEIAWNMDWASIGSSIKAAACRPATAFRWVFDTIHGGTHAAPFCGTGSSGGSAALTYSIAHYGLKNVWDYLLLAAGPAPARIDYGCDPSLYTGGALDLCPELTSAQYTYSQGVTKIADGWEGTNSCGQPNPPASDVTKWTADSVASPDADFDYPQTGMSWWFCTTTPNETTGQGALLISQVHPKNPSVDVHCYAGICQNEGVFQDPSAFNAAVAEMTANCVPNH